MALTQLQPGQHAIGMRGPGEVNILQWTVTGYRGLEVEVVMLIKRVLLALTQVKSYDGVDIDASEVMAIRAAICSQIVGAHCLVTVDSNAEENPPIFLWAYSGGIKSYMSLSTKHNYNINGKQGTAAGHLHLFFIDAGRAQLTEKQVVVFHFLQSNPQIGVVFAENQ